jgi:hypothetical protein
MARAERRLAAADLGIQLLVMARVVCFTAPSDSTFQCETQSAWDPA